MSVSIRELIAALALGTIVYWAIADGNEASSHSHRDDVHVGLLERLYRLRQLMDMRMDQVPSCCLCRDQESPATLKRRPTFFRAGQ
jgi:hypothetical protein